MNTLANSCFWRIARRRQFQNVYDDIHYRGFQIDIIDTLSKYEITNIKFVDGLYKIDKKDRITHAEHYAFILMCSQRRLKFSIYIYMYSKITKPILDTFHVEHEKMMKTRYINFILNQIYEFYNKYDENKIEDVIVDYYYTLFEFTLNCREHNLFHVFTDYNEELKNGIFKCISDLSSLSSFCDDFTKIDNFKSFPIRYKNLVENIISLNKYASNKYHNAYNAIRLMNGN